MVEISEKIDTEGTRGELAWLTVLWYIHLHALGLWGFFILFTQAKWLTVFFLIAMVFVGYLGITLGAHRYWAHRTFQAQGYIRFFLMLAQTTVGVGPIYDWVLSHRIHHEYYGTDKDPYNHNKGFLYSQFFANFMKPHPENEKIVQSIDMRDIELDGYVSIQRILYWPLFIVVGLLLPINAPAEYWGESLTNSLLILGFLRLTITVNLAWLINSAMLVWGLKPGDKLIPILDTFSLFFTLFFRMPKSHGTVRIDNEGLHTIYPADDNSVFIITKSYWPNYHYLLSWDYKSGEYGTYDSGCSALVLHLWSYLGWVSLLVTPSNESLRDALYRVATMKNVTVEKALEDVKNIAEQDAAKIKLSYSH